MKKHIITVTTTKGGVAKTTTAGALAELAARDGRRALMLDLDPQCNLSLWYRAKRSGETIYNAFIEKDLAPAIQSTAAGADLIPGSGNLIAIKTGKPRRLEAALEPIIKRYDFIVIDAGPTMGEILNNGIYAAHEILIPLEANIHSIQGLYTICDIVNRAKGLKRNLSYSGAFLAKYDRRPTVNRELREVIEDYANENNIPYLGEVRSCIKVNEAATLARPLYEYAPKCNAALDYAEIYKKITGEAGK